MKKETGAVTILMALLMLLITTGLTLMVGAVVKNEMRNSSDDYREQIAFEAASTGVHFAMEYLTTHVGENEIDDSDELSAFGICETSNLVKDLDSGCAQTLSSSKFFDDTAVPGKFWVTFCKPGSEPDMTASVPCDQKVWNENDGRVLIFARGQSDDGEANRYITAMASSLSSVKGSLAAPITGGNTVTVNGSTSIKNPYGRSSIWAADTVTFGNNKKTEVLAPQFSVAEAEADESGTATYMITGSDNTQKGPDVIEGDPTLKLSNASLDDYAKRFLGGDLETVKGLAKTALEPTDSDDDFSGYKGGLYYLTSNDPFQSMNTQIGDAKTPAIIVIDPSSGTIDISGNTEIYGILFITGSAVVTGTPNLTGGIVVYGSLGGSGDLTVEYDPDVIVPVPGEEGEVTLIGGSWKDWL